MNFSKTSFDSTTKIWSGSKMPTIYNSSVGVGYLALNIFLNSPDEITQVSYDTGIEITCLQMYRKVINMCSYLRRIGCKEGDIVGFIALNSDNLAPVVFACLTLGLPMNCVSPGIAGNDIKFFYSATKPKLIFCDANVSVNIKKVSEELPFPNEIITIDKKVDEFTFVGDILEDDDHSFIIPQIDPHSVAFILATSGTTGTPKQVCKSHKEIIEEFTAPWKTQLPSKEISFGFSGIYWISGLWTLLKGTFYCSKRVITTRTFDPHLANEIIARYKVTTLILVTPMLLNLLDKKLDPLSSVRVLIVGGITVPKALCERSKVLFPNAKICPGYGCSEGSLLAVNFTDTKFESVGQIYGNVEMKIVNADGHPLGVAEIGEIVYKSPTIFPGYFNNSVKTNETIKNGWVFSGDLGYFDEDGFLFLTDRKTDVMKYQIYVSPNELESIIKQIPDVSEVCVVAAYEENSAEDVIYAFVVKKINSDVSAKFIEDYVAARVIDEKRIRGGVHFVNSFPLTNNGKVPRFEIRKWAQEMHNNSKC